MKRLESDEARSDDTRVETMRQFLVTKRCRRLRVTEFLDITGRRCLEGTTQLCDNCSDDDDRTVHAVEEEPEELDYES